MIEKKKQCQTHIECSGCQRCTVLQCVTVMCCSGTTLQHVPCCDWCSHRWDALRSHRHGAAAPVHNPQPQQQSS